MTRTAPQSTGKNPDKQIVYLVEVVFWDGSQEVFVRLNSGSQNIDVDADGDSVKETYEAAGQFISWSGSREGTDRRGQGTRLRLSAVDLDVLNDLLANQFRGRRVRIWRAVLDPSTGVVDETYLVHRGLQLDDYKIRERVPENQDKVEAEIETRSTSRMVALQARNTVKTNTRSHNDMLARAGESTGDVGCQYTTQIQGRIFWGTAEPDPASDGSVGPRGGGGGDRDEDDREERWAN